jgi:hypothetical protein
MLKTCVNCGIEYKTYKAASKFCSTKCSADSQTKKAVKECELCGKPYSVSPYRADTARFCSHECREKAQYKLGFNGKEQQCTNCGLVKPVEEFYKNRGACKTCVNEQNKLRYEANKEKYLQICSDYQKQNKEKRRERMRKYRTAKRAFINKGLRDWRERNRERIRITKRFDAQRRRARILLLESTLTEKEWQECLEYFGHECAYCGAAEPKLTQDHFKPVAQGGGYTKDNILPACMFCNQSKGARHFLEWYVTMPYYSDYRMLNVLTYLNIIPREAALETALNP